MTKQERRSYKATKKNLTQDLSRANNTYTSAGKMLQKAHADYNRFKRADTSAKRALDKQQKMVATVMARTGARKASPGKILSLNAKLARAKQSYESGPKARFESKGVALTKAQNFYDGAKDGIATASTKLSNHRKNLGDLAAQRAKKIALHSQYGPAPVMNAPANQVYSAAGLITGGNAANQVNFTVPPAPAVVYGVLPPSPAIVYDRAL